MLAFQKKQVGGKDVGGNLEKILHSHITRKFSRALADEHATQCAAVATARKTVVEDAKAGSNNHPDEVVRARLVQYYRLIRGLELRFEAIGVQFMWRDSFQQVVKMGEADFSFEAAAALFNLAAETSRAAIYSDRSNEEGLREACLNFRKAAGILGVLLGLVEGAPWGGRCTVDLQPRTLRLLQHVMLAQAQRCFYEKAVRDAISPKLLVKLAKQLQLFYSDAEQKLQALPLRGHLPTLWPDVAACNALLFDAEANYHAAECDAAEYRYGEQVARLQHAIGLAERAVALSAGAHRQHLRATYADCLDKLRRAHEVAAKDNNVVYMATVPPFSSLPLLDGRTCVTPLIPEELAAPLSAEADPFARVLPASAKAGLDECDARVQAVVREMAELTSAAIRAGEEALSQLDLPWALQAAELDTDHALRTKIAAALEEARGSGGVGALREQIEVLGHTIGSCTDVASNVGAALDAERESEARMRRDHGEKWELLSSGTEEMSRLRSELASADQAVPALVETQARLRAQLEQARESLGALELSPEAVAARMPRAASSPLSQLPCTLELRRALDALDARPAAREELLARACALGRRALTITLEANADALRAVGAALQDHTQLGMGCVVGLATAASGQPGSSAL
jgi:programmed cell death 6-interacting protein